MRRITRAALCIFISALYMVKLKAADVNDVLETWLWAPESGVTVQSSSPLDTEFWQTLEGFLYQQNHRLLERFLNATQGEQTGLLAGIVTSSNKLVDIDDDTLGQSLSSLYKLLRTLPEELDEWPLLRRLVIASLCLRYKKHGPFTTRTEGHMVQGILLKLYEQLRQSAKRKALIEYTHVSKSGGTSFCRLAKANGCNSEDFGWGNCLIKAFDDGPRYMDAAAHKSLQPSENVSCSGGIRPASPRENELSCSERRATLLENGFTMYSNEYTAFGGQSDPALAHPCHNMITVLELRHPFSRVISHLKHMWFLYKYRCGTDREEVYFKAGRNTSHWAALMPWPTNNYLIRSLLGERVFNSPLGSIKRSHLILAREFLAAKYDIILILEDKPLFKHVLRHGLGWGVDTKHVNSRGNSEDSLEGLPQDMEALWQLNKLDLELYNFGAAMARLDAIMYEAVQAFGYTPASPASTPSGSKVAAAEKILKRKEQARSLQLSALPEGFQGAVTGSGSLQRRPFMTQQQRTFRRMLARQKAVRMAVAQAPPQAKVQAQAQVEDLPACGWIGESRYGNL